MSTQVAALARDARTSVRYDAYWVPGLDQDDLDTDEALSIAFGWLREAELTHGGHGVIAMNAASMRRNRPLLASAPWEIVSRRSRSRRPSRGPVLCVWPTAETLEFAESLAFDAALCVMAGTLFDVAPWIRRSGAICLVEDFAVPELTALPKDVTDELDHILSFGGHNSFLGGGEKEVAIRALRSIAGRSDAPTRAAIAEYMHSSGSTDADGVERAARWYDEIRQGKRHRDYARRII